MPSSENLIGIALGTAVLSMVFSRGIRFLYQGYRFRKLSDAEKYEAVEANRDVYEYHGRDLPPWQLFVLSLFSIFILACIVALKNGWLWN